MTRQDAIKLGLGRYRGEQCNKHRERRGERLAANGYCYGCHLDKRRARRAADPKRFRAKDRERQRSAKYRAKRHERDSKPEAREAKAERRRKPERRERHRERHQERVQTDLQYRLTRLLRTRMHAALRGRMKVAATMKLVGCTFERLREHIETQFEAGMNWANYGTRWHIDHIRPCASFDLSQPLQQRACFNFVNLRPLWKSANSSKGSLWGGVYWRDKSSDFVARVALTS